MTNPGDIIYGGTAWRADGFGGFGNERLGADLQHGDARSILGGRRQFNAGGYDQSDPLL